MKCRNIEFSTNPSLPNNSWEGFNLAFSIFPKSITRKTMRRAIRMGIKIAKEDYDYTIHHGGEIFVYPDLINILTEEELYAILLHESAHSEGIVSEKMADEKAINIVGKKVLLSAIKKVLEISLHTHVEWYEKVIPEDILKEKLIESFSHPNYSHRLEWL